MNYFDGIISIPITKAEIIKTLTAAVHMFDFVWILIDVSKPCQGTHSYQAQVQSNQTSFILKDFSHSDKWRFRMQIGPRT